MNAERKAVPKRRRRSKHKSAQSVGLLGHCGVLLAVGGLAWQHQPAFMRSTIIVFVLAVFNWFPVNLASHIACTPR